jgi:hypothetical protein
VEEAEGAFVVMHSPADAGHEPAYVEVARFATRPEAEAAIAANEPPISMPW